MSLSSVQNPDKGATRRILGGLQRLANPSFQVMAIRVGGAGLALGAQVLASRIMGAEEFGRYALVLVYLLLFGHFATFGTAQLLCRLLAEYLERGEKGRALGLLQFAVAATLGVSLTVVVIGLGLIHGPLPLLEPQYASLATLALAAIPLLALQDFLEAIGRGIDRPTLGIGPVYLLRHIVIIGGLALLLAIGFAVEATTVIALTIAGLFATMAIQFALLWPHLRPLIRDAKPHFSTSDWIRTALPIASVDVAEVLFANADILILGFFVPPETVALYFAASRLAQILAYVPYGVTAVTAQKYAQLAAANKRAELQALIRRSAQLATSVAFAGAVLLSIFGGLLLSFFGPEFTSVHGFIPVLCLGIVLACALGPGEDVLTMLGEERACSIAFLLALLINLVVALSLVPMLGPVGAALGAVTGLTARGVLMAWFARKRLGLVLPVFAGGKNVSRGELHA